MQGWDARIALLESFFSLQILPPLHVQDAWIPGKSWLLRLKKLQKALCHVGTLPALLLWNHWLA